MRHSVLVGKTLKQRYQIVDLLGSGGFGDTYLAADLDLPGQPKCVVKQFKPKSLSPGVLPVAKKLFDREAQFLYTLGNSSDQIPKLFAHFEDEAEFYLVQEFIDGHDLTQEISLGKPLSENVVFQLLKDILSILVVVHKNNVIHRDIKPQNLMRRRLDGKIVLIDFGAVKEISAIQIEGDGQAKTTVAVGTFGYMPSEQLNGYPKLSSDVYAVGMIGIQALTGISLRQIEKDPNTLEVIWRKYTQVSDALANVLTTMLRYDFSKRYHSAVEALQALVDEVNFSLSLGEEVIKTNYVGHESDRTPIIPENSSPNTEFSKIPYVERSSIESYCYEEICQPGALLRIKAPLQCGKTEVMSRVIHYAVQQGYRTVVLNLRDTASEDWFLRT